VFHKNGMSPMIRADGTIFQSLSDSNSTRVYIRLKYMYSVISVKLDPLPANTKM